MTLILIIFDLGLSFAHDVNRLNQQIVKNRPTDHWINTQKNFDVDDFLETFAQHGLTLEKEQSLINNEKYAKALVDYSLIDYVDR